MSHTDEAKFIDRARAGFERELDAMSAQDLARLARSRRQALSTLEARPHGFPAWRMGLGLAGACLGLWLALGWLAPQERQDLAERAPLSSPAPALELLRSEQDMAFFKELEFYAWLAKQENVGS